MSTKQRVTLVAPPVDFLNDLYGLRTRRPYRNQPPLGLGYLAAMLREAGHEVALLDAAAHGWGVSETARRVATTQPNLVGVTAITFEAPAAYALLTALKNRTDALLVLGGAHANSYYPQIGEHCPAVDVVVAGDGEFTLLEICDRLADGRDSTGVQGAMVRQADGAMSAFVERPLIDNLDDLPQPAYDLFPHQLYRPLPHRAFRLPSTCMITSRGCSYGKCTYCELSGLVRKSYRRHSPQRIIAEMRELIRLTGARDVYFQDDIFITDPEWVEEFCDELGRADLGVIWSCESRFSQVSADLLRRMKHAGCWRIFYGFESGNQSLLDRINKGFTLDQARQAVRDANEVGLDIIGFFMLGLPGETPADGEETIRFSLELGLDHAIYNLTVPHPNTPLYDLCRHEGTLLPGNDYYYKNASFVPEAYDNARQLERLRDRAFRRFYLRPAYWWRCLRRIRTWDDARYYARGFVSLFSLLD
jgi:radical SAM superfamily enzyme YgiQ (UPF0313 family)